MDFMGIGPLELLLILVLGLLFLGPEKLPGIAAKAGQLLRNFRKAAFDLSKSITEELPTDSQTTKPTVESEINSKAEGTGKTTPESASSEKLNE